MKSISKPKSIFKYVDFDTLKLIISDKTLKFSNPADFNDPFDCDVELIDFVFNEKVSSITKQEINYIERYLGKALDNSFKENMYKAAQVEKVRCSRVSCFSLKNDIVLMWSHYADKHNGVCLEFDNTIERPFKNLISDDISEGEVLYKSDERINYISEDRFVAIHKLFFNKSESWSHEKEYRMILTNNKAELQEFYPDFLKAIYFGIKVTDKQIGTFLKEFNDKELSHVRLFNAVKDNLSIKFNTI